MPDSRIAHAQAETACAKVNLTLEIKGKRADGYHELESLVVFADFGDALIYDADAGGREPALTVDGPFADACGGATDSNLVSLAAQGFAQLTGGEARGAFRLTKNLPVAAGIGGGSADAAAALRILAAGREPAVDRDALVALAREIGADVPVCLHSRATLMSGVGEILQPLEEMRPIPAVLVNPRVPLATRDVFRELGAGPLLSEPVVPLTPVFRDFGDMLAYVRASRNDLEAPACRLLPVVGAVLGALRGTRGAVLTRLSGSGPTCFALYADVAEAEAAAVALARDHPGWWIRATSLT